MIGFAECGESVFVPGMDAAEKIFEEARQAGIDLDLIDTNLALPVGERWRQHDGALRFILKLQEAKVTHDAGLQPTDR